MHCSKQPPFFGAVLGPMCGLVVGAPCLGFRIRRSLRKTWRQTHEPQGCTCCRSLPQGPGGKSWRIPKLAVVDELLARRDDIDCQPYSTISTVHSFPWAARSAPDVSSLNQWMYGSGCPQFDFRVMSNNKTIGCRIAHNPDVTLMSTTLAICNSTLCLMCQDHSQIFLSSFGKPLTILLTLIRLQVATIQLKAVFVTGRGSAVVIAVEICTTRSPHPSPPYFRTTSRKSLRCTLSFVSVVGCRSLSRCEFHSSHYHTTTPLNQPPYRLSSKNHHLGS